MKKSNIYTATGDKGTTSLVGGLRVSKSHIRLEAYGTVDELSSFIGLLASHNSLSDHDKATLRFVQNKMFNIGAYLATDNSENHNTIVFGLSDNDVTSIEHEIDRLDALVKPLCKFLIPGGSEAASRAHICRTVARRCERHIVALSQQATVSDTLATFINRLSDYFFVLARYLNEIEHVDEIFWEKD